MKPSSELFGSHLLLPLLEIQFKNSACTPPFPMLLFLPIYPSLFHLLLKQNCITVHYENHDSGGSTAIWKL
eukprot:766248-Hanusia_phi.AAC.10